MNCLKLSGLLFVSVMLTSGLALCEESIEWGYTYGPNKTVTYKIPASKASLLQDSFRLNGIGKEYLQAKKYNEALKYFQTALQLRISSVGPKHPLTGSILNNIGLAYEGKGNFALAEKYYLEDVEIQFKSGFQGSYDRKLVVKNLLDLYETQGKSKQAKDLQSRFNALEATNSN